MGRRVTEAPPRLEVQGVSLSFRRGRSGPTPALLPVDLTVGAGEFVSIVGPSGCGKSTLLNVLAALLRPTTGRVLHDGQLHESVSRDIGYMTQKDSLLPWMTAQANVELAMRLAPGGRRSPETKARARELLALVGLPSAGSKYPGELSGGMRKRVQIARLLAQEPRTILMDEPFSGLDAQRRLLILEQFLALAGERSWSVVLVTHDLFEAVASSDRVLAMSSGPGRLIGEFPIDLDRPRDLRDVQGDGAYLKAYDELWDLMRHEVEESDRAIS